MTRHPPSSTLFPYAPLSRSALAHELSSPLGALSSGIETLLSISARQAQTPLEGQQRLLGLQADMRRLLQDSLERLRKTDRKSTRLNSSHLVISYAVFCLNKK